MQTIYEPKGRAREYSPRAFNPYRGCTHKCKYCYVQKFNPTQHNECVPRKGILEALKKHLDKTSGDVMPQVLLSFTGDPYCDVEMQENLTQRAIRLLSGYHVPLAILSKGGFRMMRDKQLFQVYQGALKIGVSLTCWEQSTWQEWEPLSRPPEDRIAALKEFHKAGLKTFASFEPVLNAQESLALLRHCLKEGFVDEYKIGKLNHIELGIDWRDFVTRAVLMLREAKANFYIKNDLARYAKDLKLTLQESRYEYHELPPRPPLQVKMKQEPAKSLDFF